MEAGDWSGPAKWSSKVRIDSRITIILTCIICSQIAFRGWCSNMCVKATAAERARGGREVKRKAKDFQEELGRLRRGGGCCERCETLKNLEGKVGHVRRWDHGDLTQWYFITTKPKFNFTKAAIFFPFWSPSPRGEWATLSSGQWDITPEASRSEAQDSAPMVLYLKIPVQKHHSEFQGSCKHEEVIMWPCEAKTAFICNGLFPWVQFLLSILRMEGKHPSPPELLINYVKYLAKEGKSATFTAVQFTLYWILITL